MTAEERDTEFDRFWAVLDTVGAACVCVCVCVCVCASQASHGARSLQDDSNQLENLEWEDALYVVFAYSAVRCSGTKHEALRDLITELSMRWHERDPSFDPKTSPITKTQFREFYHTVRTGVLWPRGAFERVVSTRESALPSEGLKDGEAAMHVHPPLTRALFDFTDRALGR